VAVTLDQLNTATEAKPLLCLSGDQRDGSGREKERDE
jgi:hypothetical protein